MRGKKVEIELYCSDNDQLSNQATQIASVVT